MKPDRLAVLIVAALIILTLAPALIFDLPVTQTDGATHYVYAKTFAETDDLGAPNPPYNTIGSIEKKLSDYPPLTIIVLSSLLTALGNDVFLINGGLGVLFFSVAAISLYALMKRVENTRIAALCLLFFTLNVRAYYTLFVGIYPSFIAFCLTMPALYFSYTYLTSGRTKDLAPAIAFNLMTMLSYTPQGLYLFFIETVMWIGIKLEQKTEMKIEVRMKNLRLQDFRNVVYLGLASFVMLSVITTTFVINPGTTQRSSWLSGWFSSLGSGCAGYPCVWNYFVITDGPLLTLFALAGTLYLFTRKKFAMLALFASGTFIVLTTTFFLGSTTPVLIYVLRFYTTFYVLLSIPAAILFYRLISDKRWKRAGITLLALCILIQSAKLGYFYSQIQPAITGDEYAASKYLYDYRSSAVLFVDNENEDLSFRAFKWIVVFARSENYTVTKHLDDTSNYDYVFVDNVDKLTESERTELNESIPVFSSGRVFVYSTRPAP